MYLLDIVFPRVCVGCRRVGEYICQKCQQKLVKPAQICPSCNKPSLDGWTHPKCRTRYSLERLIVGLTYRGMVQDCLKKVKYKSAWEVISFLYKIWNPSLGLSGVVITSVPMWRQKEKIRGFNQAQILAELIAIDYRVPNIVLLKRIKETKPMFGLGRDERLANVRDSFEISADQIQQIKNCRVILVDDVWTTGSTIRECAKVLKRSGVKELWGVTLAK